MENNKSGHISEKELDGLLNEVFLNLDFENNSKNKEILAIVTKQAMRKNSLFTFFNARRFNLLFLLLSFLAFLTSFYRYIDPLLSKESEKTIPLPEIKIAEQKKSRVLLPITSYSVKSTSGHPIENIPTSTKVVNTHPAKNKFETEPKRNDETILPATSSIKDPQDSLSKLTGSDSETKNTNPLLKNTGVDSLNNVSQKKLLISSLTSKNTEAKSSKKLKPLKPSTKVKVGKRRKVNFFSRFKKNKRKGKRFLKTAG